MDDSTYLLISLAGNVVIGGIAVAYWSLYTDALDKFRKFVDTVDNAVQPDSDSGKNISADEWKGIIETGKEFAGSIMTVISLFTSYFKKQ